MAPATPSLQILSLPQHVHIHWKHVIFTTPKSLPPPHSSTLQSLTHSSSTSSKCVKQSFVLAHLKMYGGLFV